MCAHCASRGGASGARGCGAGADPEPECGGAYMRRCGGACGAAAVTALRQSLSLNYCSKTTAWCARCASRSRPSGVALRCAACWSGGGVRRRVHATVRWRVRGSDCAVVTLQYCSTAVLQLCSTVVLQYCSAVVTLQYCSTAVLQLCSTVVLQYCSAVVTLQYCSTAVLQLCSTALQYCSTAVMLCSTAVLLSAALCRVTLSLNFCSTVFKNTKFVAGRGAGAVRRDGTRSGAAGRRAGRGGAGAGPRGARGGGGKEEKQKNKLLKIGKSENCKLGPDSH